MCESRDTGQRTAPHGARWTGRTFRGSHCSCACSFKKAFMVLKKEGRRKSLKFIDSHVVSSWVANV